MKIYRISLDGIWLDDTIDHRVAEKLKDRYHLYSHEIEIINVNFFYWCIVKIMDIRRK